MQELVYFDRDGVISKDKFISGMAERLVRPHASSRAALVQAEVGC